MKKFLIRLCLLLVICTAVIGAGCYIQKDDILCITDSTSMDIKLYDIHKKQVKDLDIASIGASINLNSINSKKFLDNLKLQAADGKILEGKDLSYYNYSNWGIRVRAERNMVHNILKRSDPKLIVMVGCPVDFYFDVFYDDIDWKIIGWYLDGNPITDIPAYLRGGYPYNKGLWEKYITYTTQNQNQYENMEMDEWGGSYMNVTGDDISVNRWNEYLDPASVEEAQITAFEEMVKDFEQRGITFVYILAPYRHTFAQDESAKKCVANLEERIKTACESSGMYYYNAGNYEKYTDEYFSDCTHLNKAGAEMFTVEITEWINENVKLVQ